MPQIKSNPWFIKNPMGKWLPQSSLLRVSVGKKSPVFVGEGQRKRVYYGFAFFKRDSGNKVSKVRVVIKKFKEPLTDEQGRQYNVLLNFLRERRFPLPKSGLVKVTPQMAPFLNGIAFQGEWIAIQQFFGNSRKTAIIDRFVEVDKQMKRFQAKNKSYEKYNDFSLLFFGKKNARTDAARIMAMLVNLGVRPKFDLIAPLKKGKRNIGAIPFDYDLIVEELASDKKPKSQDLALRLVELLKQITPDFRERERLFKLSYNELKSEEVKKYLLFLKKPILLSGEMIENEMVGQ